LERVDGSLILKAPKTEKSRQQLRFPASVVAALRAHRDRRAFIGERFTSPGTRR
jgi:hypothetical protein